MEEKEEEKLKAYYENKVNLFNKENEDGWQLDNLKDSRKSSDLIQK